MWTCRTERSVADGLRQTDTSALAPKPAGLSGRKHRKPPTKHRHWHRSNLFPPNPILFIILFQPHPITLSLCSTLSPSILTSHSLTHSLSLFHSFFSYPANLSCRIPVRLGLCLSHSDDLSGIRYSGRAGEIKRKREREGQGTTENRTNE